MYSNIMVSCIMANYNTDVTMLQTAIESILHQSHTNLELIIVDDSSSDDSMSLLQSYKKNDSRVKILKNDINRGLAYSMNKAIKAAKGKYIARMDTDDISLANRIETQVKFMENHPHIGICGSFAKVFGSEESFSFSPLTSPKEIKCQLLFAATLIHPTVMFRVSFFEESEMFYNESFQCSQDYELWSRASELTDITMIRKILLLYRVHGKQVSIFKQRLQTEYALCVFKRKLEQLGFGLIDESDAKLHMMLSGKCRAQYADLKYILLWGDRLLANNKQKKVYNNLVFKRVIYNRIFNLVLKSDWNKKEKATALLRNLKLLNIYNVYSIIYRMFHIKYWSRKKKWC